MLFCYGVNLLLLDGPQVQVIPQSRTSASRKSCVASTVRGEELYKNDLADAFKRIKADQHIKDTPDAKRKELTAEVTSEDLLVSRIAHRVVKLLGGVAAGKDLKDSDAMTVVTLQNKRQKAGRGGEAQAQVEEDDEDGLWEALGPAADDDEEIEETDGMYTLAVDARSSVSAGASSRCLGLEPATKASRAAAKKASKGKETKGETAPDLGKQFNQAGSISDAAKGILIMTKADPAVWLKAFTGEYQKDPQIVKQYYERYNKMAAKYFMGVDSGAIITLTNIAAPLNQNEFNPEPVLSAEGIIVIPLRSGHQLYECVEKVEKSQAHALAQALLSAVMKAERGPDIGAGIIMPLGFRRLEAWLAGLDAASKGAQHTVIPDIVTAVQVLLDNDTTPSLTAENTRLAEAVGFFLRASTPPGLHVDDAQAVYAECRLWFQNTMNLAAHKKEAKPLLHLVGRFSGSWALLQAADASLKDLAILAASMPPISEGTPLPKQLHSKLYDRISSMKLLLGPEKVEKYSNMLVDNTTVIVNSLCKRVVDRRDFLDAQMFKDSFGACLPSDEVSACALLMDLSKALQLCKGYRGATRDMNAFPLAIGTISAFVKLDLALTDNGDKGSEATYPALVSGIKTLTAEAVTVLDEFKGWLKLLETTLRSPPAVLVDAGEVTAKQVYTVWLDRMREAGVVEVWRSQHFGINQTDFGALLMEAEFVHSNWASACNVTEGLDALTVAHVLSELSLKPLQYHAGKGLFDVKLLIAVITDGLKTKWDELYDLFVNRPSGDANRQALIEKQHSVLNEMHNACVAHSRGDVFSAYADSHKLTVMSTIAEYVVLHDPWWTKAPTWGSLEAAAADVGANGIAASGLCRYLTEHINEKKEVTRIGEGNCLLKTVDAHISLSKQWPGYPQHNIDEFGKLILECRAQRVEYQNMVLMIERLPSKDLASGDSQKVAAELHQRMAAQNGFAMDGFFAKLVQGVAGIEDVPLASSASGSTAGASGAAVSTASVSTAPLAAPIVEPPQKRARVNADKQPASVARGRGRGRAL